MDTKTIAREYLASRRVMQIATQGPDGLWACNAHYYNDDDFNFYWVSSPKSNHSRHIARNSQAAAAILVHENTKDEDYGIGFSLSGTAEIVPDNETDDIATAYAKKHVQQSDKLSKAVKGDGPIKFYRLKPTTLVMIDSKNFPDKARVEIKL